MFTGIIEELGKVRTIKLGQDWCVLEIEAKDILQDVKIGDSISVNGVCLTVTTHTRQLFTADVMPETLKKTSLSSLKNGSPVNLERAMAAGGRFGGHFVSGHVDATGTILSKKVYGNAVLYEIGADGPILRFIIPKGSIAVDGISLTVVSTTPESFSVSIIPHTLGETVLQHKGKGDIVNLECDMIGKYVERFVSGKQPKKDSQLTAEFLVKSGFM
ncbi:riboflavin synthase [Aneurinibacillus sp. Ricciae_BoGa-3]|uniref:riboflavin synthase n=1 Tax=Aneurinibacillus sp. Ricciae_BoGa-3 TaxID=3022697 RepID=UPI0023400A69|nr:riboflavin synthase [Aneurinibacillus sp. Ricciae_BoGa-3]WCK56620.1 riboflavin synthase [Aneurinibacillus sp. Ricciae_BoGa-3]